MGAVLRCIPGRRSEASVWNYRFWTHIAVSVDVACTEFTLVDAFGGACRRKVCVTPVQSIAFSRESSRTPLLARGWRRHPRIRVHSRRFHAAPRPQRARFAVLDAESRVRGGWAHGIAASGRVFQVGFGNAVASSQFRSLLFSLPRPEPSISCAECVRVPENASKTRHLEHGILPHARNARCWTRFALSANGARMKFALLDALWVSLGERRRGVRWVARAFPGNRFPAGKPVVSREVDRIGYPRVLAACGGAGANARSC